MRETENEPFSHSYSLARAAAAIYSATQTEYRIVSFSADSV